MGAVSRALGGAATFAYGLLSLLYMFTLMAFRDRALFAGPSKDERKLLPIIRKKFWSLSERPLGLIHRFVVLPSGTKLHYMVRPPGTQAKHLVIFLHGFPDSWLVWKRHLSSTQKSDATLVAVDLPGYGGSDSLPNYGPDQVLETICLFIIRMREHYGSDEGKVLVVSHDWGGVIAARLAAEAPQVADHFIIANTLIPHHITSSVDTYIASSKQMLHTWIRSPLSFRLLRRAFENISPVIRQFRRSAYIFVFNLPFPLTRFFGRMGNMWFLRLLHKLQAGKRGQEPEPEETAEYMATFAGPGIPELEDKADTRYPDSVRRRVSGYGWDEKIRIYREGLFLKPWEKSLEVIISLNELSEQKEQASRSGMGGGIFDDGPSGALKARATIVLGKRDPAFQLELCLSGIGDYLSKGSQVVVLEKGGHWTPCEELGLKALESMVVWALEKGDRPLKKALEGLEHVDVVLEKTGPRS